MKTELEQLEDSILDLEEKFSQNLPIDVALLIANTKKLSQLKVELAREEGLRAGLQIKDLKAERVEKAKSQAPTLSSEDLQNLPPIVETNVNPDHKPNFTPNLSPTPSFSQAEERRRLMRETEFSMPDVFPSSPIETVQSVITEAKTKYSELNLGKYVMGILAAILALTGTILLGTLVWNDLTNGTKATILLAVASLMTFLPLRHILYHKSGESNGFLNSLMGAGLSIFFITTIFMGSSWGFFGEFTLLLLLVLLILLTVVISYKVQSNTLLVVSYLGNFFTLLLLALREVPQNSLQISLILLLGTTIFLILFTMKNSWTTGLCKLCSLVLALASINVTKQILETAQYYLGNTSMVTYVDYMELHSPLFSTYIITLFYALLMGLALGFLLSRADDFQLGDNTVSIQTIGLFFTYLSFVNCFYHDPLCFVLLFASTLLLSRDRSSGTLLSLFFLPAFLWEIARDLSRELAEKTSQTDEIIYFFLLCGLGTFIHFCTKNGSSRRYALASMGYIAFAQLVFFIELEHALFALPLLVMLGCFCYHGYTRIDEGGKTTLLYLCHFIPLSLLLAQMLWTSVQSRDDLFEFFVAVLLLLSGLLGLSGRYFPDLQDYIGFQRILLLSKLFAFFHLCIHLSQGRQDAPLLFVQSIALLYALAELSYRLVQTSPRFPKEKPICLLLLFFSLQSWTESTALGEFSFTSSILILSIGCLSIFLGFRQKEGELRQMGLGLAILSVIKMVTVDITATDSVVRVLALILGAVLCFIISCVYNRLPAQEIEPSEAEED